MASDPANDRNVCGSMMIAVVDDDEGMRASLDGLLRSLGHRTALFRSAEAFLDCARACASDCVISDIHMPGGMSGLDLADWLGAHRPATRLILMSGFSDATCQQRAERCRAQGVLGKPFDEHALIDCLDQALAGRA